MYSNNESKKTMLQDLKNPISWKYVLRSDWILIGIVSLIPLILHLIAIKGFGYFRDELYYIACSDHLASGYVDQPPLSILLLRIIRWLLGDSRFALRLLPALSSGCFVFLAGWIARELGGKRFAVLLTSVAAFAPIGNFFIFHIYSMNFLDLLFWQACILIIIRIIKTGNTKGWILFGLVAGLGLQNKISILFLCFGLGLGLILTRQRKQLQNRHFWTGVALAGLLFLPYIVWNMTHDWAMLEFMHNARTYKMASVSPFGFFMGQMLYNNPPTLLIWLVGLFYFFFHKAGKTYRLFGWMYLAIYILFTIQQAKDYYLAAAYPILFAGGAVQWESWWQNRVGAWVKPLLVASILVPTLILCPMTLPILTVKKTIEFIKLTGIEPQPGERHEMGVLPQHFADMHGWEEMAVTVTKIYQGLSSDEQAKCGIYVRNYGEAGAIDFFGRQIGLPKATCGHNNYWLWGPGEGSGEVVIVMGTSSNIETSLEDLESHFESVQHAATFTCTYCMPYENNRQFFICRGMKGSFEEIWPSQKSFN